MRNYFEPMSACPVYEDFQAELIDGFWKAEEEKDGAGFSFYIGFSCPSMAPCCIAVYASLQAMGTGSAPSAFQSF